MHIAQALPQARIADVAGSSSIVATAAAKATLQRDSGAVCVDQESHWVAEMAREKRVPFIVLRAIADRAGDSLPPAVLVGLDAQGNPRTSAVNKYLQSWDVPNVFVIGASAFAHNAGMNPTGTVGALAFWAAKAITEKYINRPGALVHA